MIQEEEKIHRILDKAVGHYDSVRSYEPDYECQDSVFYDLKNCVGVKGSAYECT